MPRRIDSVTYTAPAQFEVGNFESMIPLGRRPQHRDTILRRGLHFGRLQGSLRCGHEDEAIELMLLIRILRREQMAEMNGIETPAEKTDFHWRAR